MVNTPSAYRFSELIGVENLRLKYPHVEVEAANLEKGIYISSVEHVQPLYSIFLLIRIKFSWCWSDVNAIAALAN
jgi:hypothetical protein